MNADFFRRKRQRHAISLARSSSSQRDGGTWAQGVHRRRGLQGARGEAGSDVDTSPHRRGAGVGEVRYSQESLAEQAVWAAASMVAAFRRKRRFRTRWALHQQESKGCFPPLVTFSIWKLNCSVTCPLYFVESRRQRFNFQIVSHGIVRTASGTMTRLARLCFPRWGCWGG